MRKGYGHNRLDIKEVKARLPSFIKLIDDTYVNMYTKCDFFDINYGRFMGYPSKIVDSLKGHPERGLDAQKLKSRKPIYEITKFLPNYIKLKEDTYVNRTTECIFVDLDYGEFSGIPTTVIKYKVGHPDRKIERIRLKNLKSLKLKLPKEVRIIAKTFVDANTKAVFRDVEHGVFEATPGNVVARQSRHPREYQKNSRGQLEMQVWVESLGRKTVMSARPFNGTKHEIDIYIPELKFGIEYNGKHWHTGAKNEMRMLNKQFRAEQDGIELLQFWCYEWENEQEQVKAVIMGKFKELALEQDEIETIEKDCSTNPKSIRLHSGRT